MNMFIKVKDGKAVDHPIIFENFRQAYPHIDVNNLPPEFARFERVDPPLLGAYEVYDGPTYEPFGDVFKDVYHIRPMTDEEKIAKQELVKTEWNTLTRGLLSSWTFDESQCKFVPPIPKPDATNPYRWDEQTLSWILVEQ